jgi:hypothetical protein
MSKTSPPALSRRGMLAGAGVAGAAVVAVAALPRKAPPAAPVTAAATTAQPDADGGYRLTPHIAHYYRTARV